MPTGCEQANGPTCVGIISWDVTVERIRFALVIFTSDLLDTYIINRSIYGAIGFSIDRRMGNDTAIVCAVNSTGQGSVYVAYNDYHSSRRQHEATKLMIRNAEVHLVNDRMNCQLEWVFGGLSQLKGPERQHTFNLSDPGASFYLLFARGPANPHNLDPGHHSFADGPLFPFVGAEPIGFCKTGCGQAAGHEWITETHQSEIPQIVKQRISIAHATLMLLSCLVLHPTAVFSARFCKDHLARCCHVFVWFHVHWICNFTAFVSSSVAFFTIYYQADFKTLPCSESCEDQSYYRRFHSILGTITYSLLCAQVLGGICRPNVAADSRKAWNLMHTFCGYAIWALSCTNSYMGIGISKLGLVASYGRWPIHVFTIGILVTIICFVLCEWIVNKERYIARDPNRVEKLNNLDSRSIENEEFEENASCAPILLTMFNTISAIFVIVTLNIMMIKSAREYGYDM
ncbi:hypothetical protein M3Y94_01194700 [Aphelenchoides besseyi]|nr:hypothetical protein M3Y94_01194700 [Aphelenchoides besseyi]